MWISLYYNFQDVESSVWFILSVRTEMVPGGFIIFLFWGWSGTKATTGLLYQPWMTMSVAQSVQCLAGETEVLGDNVPQIPFVHHKSHMSWPGLEPGPRQWEVGY
jgi:hypothetical protein